MSSNAPYSPQIVDLSRVVSPKAIEPLDFETMHDGFMDRFKAFWEQARQINPELPPYDVDVLETDQVVIVGEAFSYIRLLDRVRVNDAVKAVLAPYSTGTDLDAVALRQNVERLVVLEATELTPIVMESDAALLNRYLLSFNGLSAGSRDRYLFEAWTAYPEMLDARVNGYGVHGRRGDTDIVIIGPDGAKVPSEQKARVSAAVRAPNVQPEAVAVSVLDAVRVEYTVDLVLEIPPGPDPALVVAEAEARVWEAARSRMTIGGEIPAGFLAGAAYGSSIIKVRDLAPVAIAADPYAVPVPTSIKLVAEARS